MHFLGIVLDKIFDALKGVLDKFLPPKLASVLVVATALFTVLALLYLLNHQYLR
jgi:hypothetical protein